MAQIHRSVATLRVFGDTLLPGEISRLLGAEPDDARTKGDQLTGCKTGIVRIAKDGMWRIDATSREPGNLEEQVQEVLSRLTNDLSVWSDLSVRFEIDLFCGLFMEEGIEGLVLSADTLAALGQRGIRLELDIYGPTDN